MGQVVKEISVDAFDAAPLQVQLGNLPSGMYQVTIVAADQLIATKSLMIQQH